MIWLVFLMVQSHHMNETRYLPINTPRHTNHILPLYSSSTILALPGDVRGVTPFSTTVQTNPFCLVLRGVSFLFDFSIQKEGLTWSARSVTTGTFGFFTMGLSDAFLSDYLTDLKCNFISVRKSDRNASDRPIVKNSWVNWTSTSEASSVTNCLLSCCH